MPYPGPFDARSDREHSILERAQTAAELAAVHAERHDRDASFPAEGLAALAENGYLALVVPTAHGGESAMIAELVLGNLALAHGDASLALVVAMHNAFVGRVRDAGLWPGEVFGRVGRAIANARSGRGALVNSIASEPEMGSPSRGGLPHTRAEPEAGGWRISGRKSFASGAPVLRWGAVSAAAYPPDSDPQVKSFLVPLATDGITIEPTWDTLGMRATGSHTVVLDGVRVPAEAELPRASGSGGAGVPHERAWSLSISAVYLGVAEAARDFATTFARERKPTALGGKSIASVPHIRQRAARMDLQLYQARGLLVSAARAWDACGSDVERVAMDGALAMAKVVASNTAVAVAEEAMRLVGGSSLDRASPLERHFRDVRAGLHHPPQEDAALELLAREALD